MKAKKYVPKPGDIVWINYDPQAGREQKGHRPAFVLSPESYNEKTGLMICCPMTRQVKGRGFEIQIELDGLPAAILVDHVKSVDWHARGISFKNQTNEKLLAATKGMINSLLQIA
jgi:mRNA interferase MazF